MTVSDEITTGLGQFDREKFRSLVRVRHSALQALRRFLYSQGFVEVTTSSLVNIAGSCENPSASFRLPYYGREAHLSQSAQLQLEALVGRLELRVFTVNNSFREENYDDPDAAGRRLSEFTLIEPEMSYDPDLSDEEALDELRRFVEITVKSCVRCVVEACEPDIRLLGGDVPYLRSTVERPFETISYSDALQLVNREEPSGRELTLGDDLGIREEKVILRYFAGRPTFILHFPSHLKFFNIKRNDADNLTYSLDLLTPKLGETVGGAIRETSGNRTAKQLVGSRIGDFLAAQGIDPLTQFGEYMNLFQDGALQARMGFGVGFERLIGFLLASNDILHTISFRTLMP
jgi:asparaginyl-tRNA synthetase